jgi:hypothetical protein
MKLSKVFGWISAPSDQRSLARIPEENATAVIDDVSLPLVDWNVKGFLVAPYDGPHVVGNTMEVTVAIPFGRSEFTFSSAAKVVRRHKGTKQLAVTFTDLDSAVFDRLTSIARAKQWV